MVVPIIGRDIAAVVGGLLVATGAASVIGTLIVPRSVANWLTRWVDMIVNGAFRLATPAAHRLAGATRAAGPVPGVDDAAAAAAARGRRCLGVVGGAGRPVGDPSPARA